MSTVTGKADLNNLLGATLQGAEDAVQWLDRKEKAVKKAHETAVKVEGYRLKNLLQREIRKGAPGGRAFEPLSWIARRLTRQVTLMGGVTQRQNPNRKPIARLAHGIRYNIRTGPFFKMLVGFVQPTSGPHTVSKSWRRLADFHQKGFTRAISAAQRYFIIRRGGELGKVDGGETPFFLKRDTQKFTTPARKIVDPFWAAHARQAKENIRKNFRTKMAGKRI